MVVRVFKNKDFRTLHIGDEHHILWFVSSAAFHFLRSHCMRRRIREDGAENNVFH